MKILSDTEIKENISNWVNEYSDELYSWAFHKVSSKEVAEDIVQETFIAAFKGFENYRGESKPKTWLFSILNNKIIDYYRKEARSLPTDRVSNLGSDKANNLFDEHGSWVNNEINETLSDGELLDNEDFKATFDECIDDLPKKWSFVINSKFILNKKSDFICKELQITPSNYWQIIHRSKTLLKNCIDNKWYK